MLKVNWKTCGNDMHWCSLPDIDPNSVLPGQGVYVIFNEPGGIPTARYVGQGDIVERIKFHKSDRSISVPTPPHTPVLRITWVLESNQARRDGMERHLADLLKPTAVSEHPEVAAIEVNPPFYTNMDLRLHQWGPRRMV